MSPFSVKMEYYSAANGGMNDGYDGVGITPHIVEPYASDWNIADDKDNQLAKALECFK